MEAFLAAGGVKQKGASARRTEKRKAKEDKAKGKDGKDPNKPKRPAGGAYGCFLSENRAAFQKECPGSVAGVAKLAGERWKVLPAKDKEKYEKAYQVKLTAYQEAMKSYVPATKDEEGSDSESPS